MGQVVRFPIEDRRAAIKREKQTAAHKVMRMQGDSFEHELPPTLRIILAVTSLPLILILCIVAIVFGGAALLLICCHLLYTSMIGPITLYRTGDPD